MALVITLEGDCDDQNVSDAVTIGQRSRGEHPQANPRRFGDTRSVDLEGERFSRDLTFQGTEQTGPCCRSSTSFHRSGIDLAERLNGKLIFRGDQYVLSAVWH